MDSRAGGGGFVFAFDAADLSENIEREVSVGSRIGASAEQCAEQIRKLKRIAAERGYRLVPGHDPVAWPALTAELAAARGLVRPPWCAAPRATVMIRAAPAVATVGTRARRELRIAGLPGLAMGRLAARLASRAVATRKSGVAPMIRKSPGSSIHCQG